MQVAEVLCRRLIFVNGKGGVGKTIVSRAIAEASAAQQCRTLWVTIEDPAFPLAEIRQLSHSLWHLNGEAIKAFEEYTAQKIGIRFLSHLFLKSKIIQYLAKAAPGIHELVLLGQIWSQQSAFDRVVVDMPSTGHGLAMFQSVQNFAKLFRGGPISRDAEKMITDFKDPRNTGLVIVAIPEEMPLTESLELQELLLSMFPDNPPAFIANRVFPRAEEQGKKTSPENWPSPVPSSVLDYARKRSILESHNLRLWKNIEYGELRYYPPTDRSAEKVILKSLANELFERGYVCR